MNETLRGIEIIKKMEIVISYWEKIPQNPYVLQIAANGWCCYLTKEEEGVRVFKWVFVSFCLWNVFKRFEL